MPKKQKLFKYNFADGERSIPSSNTIICNKTGEKVNFYHKQLVKKIQKEYKNNYNLFEKTFIKRGVSKDVEDDEDASAPEGYRKYLIIMYSLTYKNSKLDERERANKLEFYSECYKKRYDDDISKFVL